jgi:MFS family permease
LYLRSPFSEKTTVEAESADAEVRPMQGFSLGFARLSRLRALTSLQHRDFRLLWFGHVFTSMGFWMDQVSRGWLIYELTDSTVQLGLVRGVQAIPILLLSPVAGSAADRYSRKTQILVSQVIDGTMFAALAVLIFTGTIQPWHVYVTAFAMARLSAMWFRPKASPTRSVLIRLFSTWPEARDRRWPVC